MWYHTLIKERGADLRLKSCVPGFSSLATLHLENEELSSNRLRCNYKLSKIKYCTLTQSWKLHYIDPCNTDIEKMFIIPRTSNVDQTIKEYDIYRDKFSFMPCIPNYIHMMDYCAS